MAVGTGVVAREKTPSWLLWLLVGYTDEPTKFQAGLSPSGSAAGHHQNTDKLTVFLRFISLQLRAKCFTYVSFNSDEKKQVLFFNIIILNDFT